jgi:hypothetical protein
LTLFHGCEILFLGDGVMKLSELGAWCREMKRRTGRDCEVGLKTRGWEKDHSIFNRVVLTIDTEEVGEFTYALLDTK